MPLDRRLSDFRFLPDAGPGPDPLPLLLVLLAPLFASCPNTESEFTTIVSVKLEVVNFGANPSLPVVSTLSCFESATLVLESAPSDDDAVDKGVVNLAGCTMGFSCDDTFSDLLSFL